jgi:tetratricopeptide (TPR) repeat protein
MPNHPPSRLLATAGALAIALSLGAAPALADSTPSPAPPAPTTTTPSDTKSNTKKKKTSEQQFMNGYKLAYDMIQSGSYEAGIAALRQLDEDDHPDVANYIGFASRKLGRYDDAKVWYERALAADPNHVRTWQYYGMWHVEQGNMLKAADHLEKINLLCGTSCKEYVDLKGSMDGKVSY